jgi:hypothetical protein
MDDMKLLADFCASEPVPEPERLARARATVLQQLTQAAADSPADRALADHARAGLAPGSGRPRSGRPRAGQPRAGLPWRVRPLAGAGRGRVLIPLAAAVAVTVVAVGIAAAGPLLGGGRQPAAPARPPAVPRFFVDAPNSVNPPSDTALRVYATATGGLVASIQPPHGRIFTEVAAVSADTFVAAASTEFGRCSAALNEFRLGRGGVPGPLRSLGVTVPGNFVQWNVLASARNGQSVAYATGLPGCAYPARSASHAGFNNGEIGLVNLATGKTRVWTTTGAFTTSLGLSADGRSLVFTQWVLGHGSSANGDSRLLPAGAPAGAADQRSRIVSETAGWAALNAHGTTMYACRVSAGGTVTYYAESTAGGPQRVLASWPGQAQASCSASLDPTGSYLLIQLLRHNQQDRGWLQLVRLDIRTGQLAYLPRTTALGVAGSTVSIAW